MATLLGPDWLQFVGLDWHSLSVACVGEQSQTLNHYIHGYGPPDPGLEFILICWLFSKTYVPCSHRCSLQVARGGKNINIYSYPDSDSTGEDVRSK